MFRTISKRSIGFSRGTRRNSICTPAFRRPVISRMSPSFILDGLGTTKPAFLVINISDIQFIKSEAEPVGRPCVGNGAEENNRRGAAAPLEGVVFRKFRHAADHDPDFAGNRHPDHRLAEEIGGHLIIRYNNAGSLQKGNPGFQDLAMNQTVIDPHEGYIQ